VGVHFAEIWMPILLKRRHPGAFYSKIATFAEVLNRSFTQLII